MSKRNISKEIFHYEGICYPSLICILTELIDRVEQLEKSQHIHSEMNND